MNSTFLGAIREIEIPRSKHLEISFPNFYITSPEPEYGSEKDCRFQ